MLHLYLVTWTILKLVSEVGSARIPVTNNSGTLSDALWAILDVLEDSWLPGRTLAFISNDRASFSTIYEIIENIEVKYNYAVFDTSLGKPDGNTSVLQSAYMFESLNKIRKSSGHVTLIVTSDEASYLRHLVEEAIDNDLLIWPARLLVVTRLAPPHLRSLQETLSSINVMVLALEHNQRTKRCGIYMYLPYSLRMVKVATWTQRFGLSYRSNYELFPDKFRRLTDGAHLVVVGQNFPPHVVVRRMPIGDGDEEDIQFSGPLITTLEMLAADINFTYSLVQPSDGSWGYLFPNGTWNGMIGMMIRKEVDFGLGPFGITFIRAQVIDYTSLLVVDYGRILGRRGDTEVNPWSFAFPLTYLVWAALFSTLIFIASLARLTFNVDRDEESHRSEISEAPYLRAFLQQDIKSSSNRSWDRMMLGVWMLGVLVFIKSYSTNLMSLLAVRRISEPYQSVRDMLDDPKVASIWFANTAYMQYLSVVDSGIYYEVAQTMNTDRMKLIRPSEYAPTVNEFVSRGDHVMINPFLIMKMFLTEDYMDDKGRCKFYVSKERFLPLTFCMVVPKYSPLRGPINEGIRAVVEGGLYDYWLDNAFANAKSCKNPPSKITVRESLSLSNVWGIFVVLMMGYAVSLVCFCLELGAAKMFP